MDNTWAVSSWNAPHHSPRAHAAGLDEINSFFDSAPSSPAISASAATAEQLPADTTAPRQQAAAATADEVLLEPASGQTQIPLASQPSCEFSSLLADIEAVEATAAQAERLMPLGGATALGDWQPRPRPTLLPSPMPDIALLPDGTIDAPVKKPVNAGKRSMFDEMRDEEAFGNLPRQDQPLALDFGMNAHGIVHNVLNTNSFGAAAGEMQGQAPYLQVANDRHLLTGYGEAQPNDNESVEQEIARLQRENEMLEGEMNGQQQENNGLGHEFEWQKHAESDLDEQARSTMMADLEETLAAMQEAGVPGTGFENVETQDDAVANSFTVTEKRERASSIRDDMAGPPGKKAKTPDSAQAEGGAVLEGSVNGQELPFGQSAYSQQVGKTWAHGMMAEQKPAGLMPAGRSSSPLSDTTDADAPGTPDSDFDDQAHTSMRKVTAPKPTGRFSVGTKQVDALVNDVKGIALQLDPGPVKTRQQKKAQDELKPNASAAVKRRRSGN